MQLHSSYVLTDPKGTVLIECGKLLQRAGYRIKVLNTINFKNLCTTTPLCISAARKIFEAGKYVDSEYQR